VPVNVAVCAVDTDRQKGVPAYERLAVGNAVIVAEVVAFTAAHPPEAGIE
jgi:hypothetical protein